MSFSLRQKLLASLNNEDLDWYSSILSENKHRLNEFIDSTGQNFFHDIAISILPQTKLKEFVFSLSKVFDSKPCLLADYLNSFAKIYEDAYTPLHLAIVKRKKVLEN